MTQTNGDINSPEFVRELFNEMSRTYGVVNVVSSFGFCLRWRRQCLEGAGIHPHHTVCDLMSGMGELWPSVVRRLRHAGHIFGVDLSPAMSERARKAATRLTIPINVLVEDALANSIQDGRADVVVSSFGLKTFNDEQLRILAHQVARILKPGGRLSFVEISAPPSGVLRKLYMFYVGRVIPVIGRLLLGNPENYRLLGVYTESFANCSQFLRHCADAGLRVQTQSYFFGCATGVVGDRPAA